MSRSKEIISHASSYSLASLMTQFVSIVSALLMRHFLGPVQVGIWSLVQVILTYANYSNLGTMDAITMEIPFYQGKGDSEKVERIKNTSFTFAFLTSLVISLGVLTYALYFQNQLPDSLFYALLFTAGLIILQRLNALLISLIRAYKHFELAGKVTFYSAIVNAMLIALLSFRYKLYGFMVAMCLSFLFNIFYILIQQSFYFKFSLEKERLRALISYGFPLMLLSLFSTFFETIDKIMITKFLGLEALGLYSIALMTYTYINSVPNAISIVLIPNLHEKYGARLEKADLREYLNQSDFIFSNLMPILIGLSWFFIPALIGWLLPKFLGGIAALRWLVLGSYFLGVGMASSLFIYVIRKHFTLFPITAASCALAVVFNGVAIWRGWGITGIAAATTLAMLCQFTLLYIYAYCQVHELKTVFYGYSVIILKFFWMTTLLFCIDRWVHTPNSLLSILCQSFIFFLAYLPFLLAINRKLHLVSLFKERFFKVA